MTPLVRGLGGVISVVVVNAVVALSGCSSGSSSDLSGSSPRSSSGGPSASGLVVHEPIPFRVAAPEVPIRAECRGPRGGSCEFEVWISWDHDDYYLPIGSSTNGKLDIVADLSGYHGREGDVHFRATFSTGESAHVARYIIVEKSTALDRVTRVDGAILDTDGERVLYRRTEEETGHRYFVRSLEDGSIAELAAPGDLELYDDGYAWLTSQGALLVLRDGKSARVIDARPEAQRELVRLSNEYHAGTVRARGDYAIWRAGGELWRWRFSNEEALLITGRPCSTTADLLDDGAVAFCRVNVDEPLPSGTLGEDVYLFAAGGTTRITDDGAKKEDIRSDGSSFVYRKSTEYPAMPDSYDCTSRCMTGYRRHFY